MKRSKKTNLLVLFLSASLGLQGQQQLFEKELPEDFRLKGTIQITNPNSHAMALLFLGSKSLLASQINDRLEETASFETGPFPKQYDIPIGAQQRSESSFVVYLANKGFDDFGMVEVDFNTGNTRTIPIDLEFKKEYFLGAFSHKEKTYMLSIENKSSILNFYVLDPEGGYIRNTLDLSGERFRHWDNTTVNIHTLLTRPFGRTVGEQLVLIDASTPNSLETSAAPSKLFLEEEAFYLTFESNRNITQLVKIDPRDFSYEPTSFNKPYIPNAPEWKKANSFIFDGKYLGVTATRDELRFEVKDLNSREVINSYSIEKDRAIEFKNTPIEVEGSLYRKGTREIENENRFLRDLSNAEIGVTIYAENDRYIVSLGSFENATTSIVLPIPVAQLGFLHLSGLAYLNITKSNSTQFKSIFNSNFEHEKGDVPKNSFDRIGEFMEARGDLGNPEVFNSMGVPVLGYLDPEKNHYRVVKF